MWFQALEFLFSLYSSSQKKCAVARERKKNSLRLLGGSCSSYYYSEKNYLSTAQETDIQAPGTTFLNFSYQVRPEEGHESDVALAHPLACTKELMSGLPFFGSMATFGARRAEKRNVLRKQQRQTGFHCLRYRFFFFFLWAVQQSCD